MKPWIRASRVLIVGVLIAYALCGCAYLHTQRPLSVNFQKTELGAKAGRSSLYSLCWLVAWGDAGTRAAAQNGGIKTIEYADTEVKCILFGLYTRVTTVVYGD